MCPDGLLEASTSTRMTRPFPALIQLGEQDVDDLVVEGASTTRSGAPGLLAACRQLDLEIGPALRTAW